jgi:hypothetical protein
MKSIISFLFISVLIIACEKQDNIKWNLIGLPIVEDLKITNNSIYKFSLYANFKSVGNDKNAKIGFVITKSNFAPTINNCDSVLNISDNKVGPKIIEVEWYTSQTIHARAFIINELDTVYTDEILVNWQGNSTNLPQVLTLLPTEIKFYSARLSTQVVSSGNLTLNKLGVLISTNSTPTLNNSFKVEFNSNQSSYSEIISGLNENTTYYVRGFAENIAGVGLANNIINITTKNFYHIGEVGPAGGLIFYNKIDSIGGWNFLECYPNEVATIFPWNLNINQQLNLGTEIGTGKSNTQSIVSFFGNSTNYAAKFCNQLSFGGYNDWFLPSRDELIEIYQSLFANNIGGFVNDSKYWSSSDDDFFIQNAWCQKMTINTGSVNAISEQKNINLKVRPIRCF